MSLENLLTKSSFTQLVEALVLKEKMTYIEAVLHVCEERGLDPGDVSRLISPAVKAKIEAEGMAANLLPRYSSLDSFL